MTGAPGSSTRWRWIVGCALSALGALAALGAAQAAELAASGDQANEAAASCALLTPWPWPTTTVERRLHLRRMGSAQDQCIGHAAFLATLGALWLEEGDAEKARVWLERSLLLEPENLGALADHALALAALGEPAALKELSSSWRARSDVPLALRRRIEAAPGSGTILALAPARLGGGMDWPRYASRREASILFGYDSNLGVSPQYSDFRIIGGDPQSSPPLRRGGAVRADVSWLGAWELNPRRVARAGLSLMTRSAPGESSTDWHQAQATASITQRWNGWSASVQADAAWFGGALTEPYVLGRARLVLEQLGERCSHATQLEADGRRQRETRSHDSTTVLLAWRLQCQPFGRRDLQWSVALRGGTDRPNRDERPGGVQRSLGGTLRLEYRPDALTAIDLSVGALRLDDSEIYSEVIPGHPVRHQAQSFAAIELSRALNRSWFAGAEWVVQVSGYRQTSNIPLFQHKGTTAYTGLRWPW
jgi:hypothetical protein